MIILWAVTTSKRTLPFLTAASFSISSKTGFARTNIGTDLVSTIGFGVTECRRNATFINVWGNTIEAETELVLRFLLNKQRNKFARLFWSFILAENTGGFWGTCYMFFLFSYSLFTGFRSFNLIRRMKVIFSCWLRHSPLLVVIDERRSQLSTEISNCDCLIY